ncbi:DUF1127 domain-containing protein [Stappia sp. F7233]|uniref:DUF1127 domain-containing protein n=1 Tax=Stappia albiluteola TaxID=2758565 RepID=A0A839ADP5_9HYPH|nr:DUF1127 domain-containing protein [Stappia albiluteola]MBA5777032.1 DUF1127 domain-containing protein [Stappia albiluteola]
MTSRSISRPIGLLRIGGWTATIVTAISRPLGLSIRSYRTRRALDALDDRMLKDIGLARGYEGYERIDEMTGRRRLRR